MAANTLDAGNTSNVVMIEDQEYASSSSGYIYIYRCSYVKSYVIYIKRHKCNSHMTLKFSPISPT